MNEAWICYYLLNQNCIRYPIIKYVCALYNLSKSLDQHYFVLLNDICNMLFLVYSWRKFWKYFNILRYIMLVCNKYWGTVFLKIWFLHLWRCYIMQYMCLCEWTLLHILLANYFPRNKLFELQYWIFVCFLLFKINCVWPE